MLSAEKKGYIAGLIDAEMTIQIQARQHRNHYNGNSYRGYSVYLELSNTDMRMINWMLKNVGGTWGRKPNPNPDKWKQAYYWKLSGKETKALLSEVRENLVCKGEQADLVARFPFGKRSQTARNLKEELYTELRRLNKTGI